MRKVRQWMVYLLCGGLALGLSSAYVAGSLLTAPVPSAVGKPPAGLPIETVNIASPSGSRLAGWFIRGRNGGGAVLLLHGIGANRLQMLDRARFLHRDGYSVLLFDFQAEGESPGTALTFGHLEAMDARAAFDFLRAKVPGERVGVIGLSLGGAAAVLTEKPLEADAMVLEAVYGDFETAVINRMVMRLGEAGRLLTPLLTLQARPRLGFWPSALAPARRIAEVRAPVLIIAGGEDQHATMDETKAIFANARDPKDLWVIKHAGHEDFHDMVPQEYERRVGQFLNRTLRRQ